MIRNKYPSAHFSQDISSLTLCCYKVKMSNRFLRISSYKEFRNFFLFYLIISSEAISNCNITIEALAGQTKQGKGSKGRRT